MPVDPETHDSDHAQDADAPMAVNLTAAAARLAHDGPDSLRVEIATLERAAER